MALLAPHLIRFISTSIRSVPFLEALLLIRSTPKQYWTASELSQRLYISDEQSNVLLTQLQQAGMASREEHGYLYSPATPRLDALIDELAHAYAMHLVPVTKLIHSRSNNAAHFSNAFRFRKE